MKTLLIFLAFACIVLIYFQDVIIGPNLFLDMNPFYYDPWRAYASEDGLEHKTYRTDSFTTYLPRRAFLSESIAAGRLPLWNPNVFAGMPFLADPQTRVFYPIELLLTRVSPLKAMGYDVAIHVFLAMTGMFLFLRSIRVNRLGAFVGGCAYAFSSFFHVRFGDPTLIASGAWVPFLFYGFELARRRERLGTLLLAAFFTMGYLSGFPQVLVFGVGALLVYSFWLSMDRPRPGRIPEVKRTARVLGIGGGLALLIVSVQMIPFIEFFRESVGLHYDFEQLKTIYIAPPVLLLRSLFPGLFGNPVQGTDWSDLTREAVHPYHPEFAVYCGLGVLILAILALRRIRTSSRLRVLVFLLVLSVGLAVSPLLLRAGYALVPVLRNAKISRISVISCFALSTLGALGITAISSGRLRAERYLTLVLICVIGFMAVSSVAFELAGESVTAGLAERARSIPEDRWMSIHGYTRSGRIMEWMEGGQAEWVSYEREQLRRGLYFTLLASALILLWARSSRPDRKWGAAVGILLAGLLVFDIASVSKTYYISQTPESVSEAPGIRALKGLLGEPGNWRTRIIRRTLEEDLVLPVNTNQIFGIHSLDGTSTMYPKSYANFRKMRIATEAIVDSPPNRRSWLASELDDLMAVRFLIAPTDAPRYATSSIMRRIAVAVDSPSSLGMLEVGGDKRFALKQTPGDVLATGVSFPAAAALSFSVGFNADGGMPGDSVFFEITCDGDGDAVVYRQGFDLSRDGGIWRPASLDVSKLSGAAGSMTFSLAANRAGGEGVVTAGQGGSITGGWSRLQFVVSRRPYRETARGYEIDLASRGRALSLELGSGARGVPLEIGFDDGAVSRRVAVFPDEMKSRWLMIDLRGRKTTELTVESDSAFSVMTCRQVWRPWVDDLDCQLIYDADMCIYENTGAMEKGLCIRREHAGFAASEESGFLALSSLRSIDDAICGKCEITHYEPERVELEVAATADCYLLLQDMYYPGWRAHIDGRDAAVLDSDLGIRAIEVPEGSHTVVVEFKPMSFYIGLALTCFGLILTLVYALRTRPLRSIPHMPDGPPRSR